MQSPEFASSLSMKRIDYYRGQLNQIKTQMAEKPDDQKLQQAFQQASMGLNQAIAQNKQLSNFMVKQQAEQTRANKLLIDQQRADAATLSAEASMIRANKKTTTPGTAKERMTQKLIDIVPTLQSMDPNEVYRKGYQVEDDGSIATDLTTGAAIPLPKFTKEIGKRGGPRMLKAAGELYDDAKELHDLLLDPEVSQNLQSAVGEGLWDRARGSFSNRVTTWMSKKGILKNSKTATAVRRMQRMASEERKAFLGSAVTATELETTLGWMPAAGDSYDAMINKTNLILTEGRQEFKRFLDLYKDVANMSPWYRAFGLKRVEDGGVEKTAEEPATEQTEAQRIIQKYGLD
jgi:hypothetical protein